jgi:hypothetical protein
MAALVTEGSESLQVALSHLFFNVFGIVIWYPIPFMRSVPLNAARQLGKATRAWKGFPMLYIAMMFLVMPMFLLAISTMFSSKKTGEVVAASILLVLFCAFWAWFIWWWRYRDGKNRMGQFFFKRQRNVNALETLPYDMHWLQRKIKELQEHAQCQPAPTPKISPDMDPKAALVTIADDMENALNTVNALIEHTGLPGKEDTLGPNGEDLGRFVHKEKEDMPDVDTSQWMQYQLTVLAIAMVIFALLFWGFGTLLASDTTADKGLGGLLAIVVGLFYIYRFAAFFLFDGKENSLKSYRDRKLRKMAQDDLVPTLAQVKADIKKLAADTNLPAEDAAKEGEASKMDSPEAVDDTVAPAAGGD